MTVVYRKPGDKPGPDIVSSVLTTVEAQVERGRQEINYEQPDRVIETIKLVDTDYQRPGSTARVWSRGKASNGRLNTFALSIIGANISGTVLVEVSQ